MKTFTIYGLVLLTFTLLSQEIKAQGCVAIRQLSGLGNAVGQGSNLEAGEFNASMNYRYFKSFRHFSGTTEHPHRLEDQTEVINWSHGWDLNLSYAFTSQWYGILSLPFVYNERSSIYEHGRAGRYMTYSGGLADMRVGGGYWILPDEKSGAGNMAFGLSLKMPTGDYRATSTFYHVGPNGEPEVRPVDQSIQPGDGGWGFILDVQGLWNLPGNLIWYYDGFYMFNPQNTNGTETNRRRASESIMSIPDQYAFRTGTFMPVSFIHGLGLSLGARWEGIPVRDALGKSEGFRRPGYIVSVEPGISYMLGNFTLTSTLPWAIVRNRTRSLTDINDSINGQHFHGDAAFADYLINVSLAYRVPSLKKPKVDVPNVF